MQPWSKLARTVLVTFSMLAGPMLACATPEPVVTAPASTPGTAGTAGTAGTPGTSAPPATPAAPPDAKPTTTEVVGRALPAVMLLVATKPNGAIGYGSGLIVSKEGLVLTSLHVVERAASLRAMPYRAGRVSYTPMDGGLERYLFENQAELAPAALIASDPVADLAVVKVDADTSAAPLLPFSSEAVRPGDRVLAIGHPQETVWSFTSGAVIALPQGAIQHDAVISHGSSGGPLLNERGEVIGVNTARVISEARGFAFARPIAMAGGVLRRPIGRHDLDLSTPAEAARSCWRAAELSSPSLAECVEGGLSEPSDKTGRVRDLVRMGLRVEEARLVAPDRAWLLVTGRMPDGSRYRYSSCWVKVDGRWRERELPAAPDLALLPAGWPAPAEAIEVEASTAERAGHADHADARPRGERTQVAKRDRSAATKPARAAKIRAAKSAGGP